jgi:CRP/FNR family cyclic AMP-dependent transcriptional regulator
MSVFKYQLLQGLGLSERFIVDCLRRMNFQTYESGSVILRLGETPKFWTHITTGLVGVTVSEAGNKTSIVSMLGEGAWFGEAAILSNQPNKLEYVSFTTSRVLSMPIQDMQTAFDTQPEFARYVARLIAWRNQQQSEAMALMRSGSPQLRIIMGLALLAEAQLNSASHLPGSSQGDELDVPLKQAVLASICGVSRGVFSECIVQLARAGWLRLNYATLSFLQVQKWEQFCKNYRNNGTTATRLTTPEILLLMGQASPEAAANNRVSTLPAGAHWP